MPDPLLQPGPEGLCHTQQTLGQHPAVKKRRQVRVLCGVRSRKAHLRLVAPASSPTINNGAQPPSATTPRP